MQQATWFVWILGVCAGLVVMYNALMFYPFHQLSVANVTEIEEIKPPPIKHQKHVYMTTQCKGRLGNQMFQYAALLGYTKANTMWTPVIHLDRCNVLQRTFSNLLIPRVNFTIDGWTEIRTFDDSKTTLEKLDTLPTTSNVTLNGHLQSIVYFWKSKEDIRDQFVFPPEINRAAEAFLEELKQKEWNSENVTVVGIHIRRSDQLTEKRFQKGIIEHPRSYFIHAMDYFTARFQNVQFIVTSEEPSWYKENLANRSHIAFSGQKVSIDFAILTKCDHLITSIGTFSWWAGWLNKGIKVYYGVLPPKRSKIWTVYNETILSSMSDNNWVPIV